MKKIIIATAAASLLLFTGCFFNSDTATVVINLGNMPGTPVAKVEKKSLIDRFLMVFAKEAVAQEGLGQLTNTVHLGAFDSNNQLLAKKRISVGQQEYPEGVTFDVPAMKGVTIVVLYEEKDQSAPGGDEMIEIISHYGKSEPQNLKAGATVPVKIYMKNLTHQYSPDYLDLNDEFNMGYFSTVFKDPVQDGGEAPTIVWDTIFGCSKIDIDYDLGETTYKNIYSGSDNRCTNRYYNGDTHEYQVTLHFNFAGEKKSSPIVIYDMPLLMATVKIIKGGDVPVGVNDTFIEIFDNDGNYVHLHNYYWFEERPTQITDYNNGFELKVFAGKNRTIMIKGYDGNIEAHTLIYGMMVTTDLAPGETKTINARWLPVPYDVDAYAGDSKKITFLMRGPEKKAGDFMIMWAQGDENGPYINLATSADFPFTTEGGPEGQFRYNFTFEAIEPSKFFDYIKIKVENPLNMSLFSLPKLFSS